MQFGEEITLSDSERAVMQYGEEEFAATWPLQTLLVLEGFVRQRLLDKQNRLEEVKRGIGGTLVADGFRLRRDIGQLEQMHEELLQYALSPDNQPPATDS